MRLDYMRELLALEKHKTFTQTAKVFYITQPALSRHIDAIENELGTILVRRNTHRVEFTEDGRKACETFTYILESYDALKDSLEGKKKGVTGTLRLGMLYYTISQDFGTILPAFQMQYPQIQIKTSSYQPQEMYQALMEDKIDIGVLPEANYLQADLLNFKEFVRTGAAAMVSSAHKLASCKTISLKDLTNETLVLLRDDPCSTLFIKEALARCNFTPNNTIEADHIDTVPFTILSTNSIHINGNGFSIPGYDNQIKVIPIIDPDLYFAKSYAYCKANDNPAISLFLNMINNI